MIDVHCHLYDEKMNEIRSEVLSKLVRQDLFCITSGDNLSTSVECVKLSLQNSNIYATVGTHPHEADKFCDSDLDKYKEMAKLDKVVAIGEIGLDYHYEFSPRDIQKEVLKKQIKLAKELSIPCVFHVREATKDFLDLLEEMKDYITPSLLHSFNGSIDTAKILLKYGFYFSFNGIATFSNARNVLEVIDFLPMERILLETDSPYLSPVPHRGEVNKPENIVLVAKVVADIKQKSIEEVLNITQENAKKLFKI